MYFRCFLVTLLVASWPRLAFSSEGEVSLLEAAVNSLFRGLQFMEHNMKDMNLDGGFGCRLLSEHIDAFLMHRPEVFEVIGDDFRSQLEALSQKASDIATNSKPYMKENDPEYYKGLDKLLDKSEVLIWYPSRTIDPSLADPPHNATDKKAFNETFSDTCLKGLLGTRENGERCTASLKCLEFMTKPKQDKYIITHQMLYFQMMEKQGCLGKTPEMKIPEKFPEKLCANILKEAEQIALSNYPLRQRDLFMEQIGLCGIWGFKDFYKNEWLQNILSWQKPVGCYPDLKWNGLAMEVEKRRVKREEKRMPGGCLSHKTAVALLAITIDIRFIAEEVAGIE